MGMMCEKYGGRERHREREREREEIRRNTNEGEMMGEKKKGKDIDTKREE